MKGPSNMDVQSVVYEFTRRCFVGGIPPMPPDAESATWVLDQFANREILRLTDVAIWPVAKQAAVYERLQEAIIQLGLDHSAQFRPDELHGSGPECLAQPLLADLATVSVPSLP